MMNLATSSVTSPEKSPVWVQLTLRIQPLTAWPFPTQDEKKNPSKVSARTMVFSIAFAMGCSMFLHDVYKGEFPNEG